MIEKKVASVIEGAVAELGFRLVRVLLSGTGGGRRQLQIMAEPADDRQMTVEDCEKISRWVSGLLEAEDPIAGSYTLEVSSPGIDRPLVAAEDFERFAGELARVQLRFAKDGRRRFRGRLSGLDESGHVVISTEQGDVALAPEEIETARIDPAEILNRMGLADGGRRADEKDAKGDSGQAGTL